MFAAYFKELEGMDTVMTDRGFAVYSTKGKECYIAHMYVEPEYRCQGEGSRLFNIIVDKLGSDITEYTANVFKSDRHTAKNLEIYKKRGFKVIDETPHAYLILREI